MTCFGYMRISTEKQDHDAQRNAIERRHEIDEWVIDTGTGKVMQANLSKLCRRVKKNDRVIVFAFDRLGRSTVNVIATVEDFKRRGVSLVSVKEGIDINSPAGNMVFQMMCSIAEFELSLMSDRIRSGIEAAKARGVKLGAPRLDDDPKFKKIIEIGRKHREEGKTYREVCDLLRECHKVKLSYGALYNYLKPHIP